MTEQQSLKVGKLIGAKYLLIGSFQKLDPQIRIQIRIMNTETGEIETSKAIIVDGKYSDIFLLQDKISVEISNKFSIDLTEEEKLKMFLKETSSTTSYEFYNLALAETDQNRKEEYYKKALKFDPNYAKAHAAYASYLIIKIGEEPQIAEVVEEHALKAVELDPTLAESYYILGYLNFQIAKKLDKNTTEYVNARDKCIANFEKFIQLKGDSNTKFYKSRVEFARNKVKQLTPNDR